MEDEGKASWRLRAALPLLVASNVALIAASHVCKGAATHVDGHAPLGTLTPHIASDDNLPSAVGKLWAARAYWMVFLVALLSGALPYLKLIATCGVVGLFDTGQLTAASAKTAFLILEVIGKYSFADVFLICLNCLIFDISTGGSYKILLFGSLELKLWVQLKFGAVALIVAITFSAFLTHWAAYEISPESHKEEGADEEEAPLLDTHEIRAGQNQLTAVQAASKPVETYNSFLQQWFSRATPSRLLLSLLMCSSAIAGMVVLIICAGHPMIKVTRDGFLGKLIRPPEDRTLMMGIFSITGSLQHLASVHGRDETRFFSVMFVLLTFIAPMLELIALLATGLAICISRTLCHYCRFVADWVHSFGCVEVLMIVMVISVYELHTVVKFNIGSECKPFESMMQNKAILTIAGIGFAADDTCFEPKSELQVGFWLALVAVLLRCATWRVYWIYEKIEENKDLLSLYSVGKG